MCCLQECTGSASFTSPAAPCLIALTGFELLVTADRLSGLQRAEELHLYTLPFCLPLGVQRQVVS